MDYTSYPTKEFLSTPSVRRATSAISVSLLVLVISIHALREEGDVGDTPPTEFIEISIHALREEGDQSSPDSRLSGGISIHALREEGDVRPV